MLSSLLGQLKLDEQEAEMGDDSVLEHDEKDGEKKEGQEGEENGSEKKELAEPVAKTPKPSVSGDKSEAEENKNTDSVAADEPKADK